MTDLFLHAINTNELCTIAYLETLTISDYKDISFFEQYKPNNSQLNMFDIFLIKLVASWIIVQGSNTGPSNDNAFFGDKMSLEIG